MPEPCCLKAVPRGLELGGVGFPERSEMSEAGFTRLESERLILPRFKASDLAPFLASATIPRWPATRLGTHTPNGKLPP